MEAIIVIWIACAVLCGFIASTKGRDPMIWGFIGGIAGIFAIIAICAVPAVEKTK